MPPYKVAFDEALTDTATVEARDAWDAAILAAEGLPGRDRPAADSAVFVYDHADNPPAWKRWHVWHRIEVSVGFAGLVNMEVK